MPDFTPRTSPRLPPRPVTPISVPQAPAAFTPDVPPLPWYASKTTWMGVLTVIISLAPFIGNVIPADEREAFSSAMAIIAPIVGSLIGALVIWFRRSADAPIKGGRADQAKKKA